MNLQGRKEVVEGTMPVARKLARMYFHRNPHSGLELEDFEAAAYFGLCDAASRFDPERLANFRTFAFQRIWGAMADLVRQAGVISRANAQNFNADRGNRIAFSQRELGGLADALLESGLRLHIRPDGTILGVSYEATLSPEGATIIQSLKRLVHELLGELPERERQVLILKYFDGLTFEEMREHFAGATRSWLCRIHSRALLRLRRFFLKREQRCFARIEAAAA